MRDGVIAPLLRLFRGNSHPRTFGATQHDRYAPTKFMGLRERSCRFATKCFRTEQMPRTGPYVRVK